MAKEALEARVALLMSLLKDQEARGVERCTLQTLAKKIQEAQQDLIRIQEQETAPKQQEAVRYEDGDDPDKPFRYGRPKKWPLRTTIRKGSHQTVKRAHPTIIGWHGRLA